MGKSDSERGDTMDDAFRQAALNYHREPRPR